MTEGNGDHAPRSRSGVVRLRNPTLATAPMTLVAVMAATVVIWMALWAAWGDGIGGAPFWASIAVATAVLVVAVTAALGCFVSVDNDRRVVRDVVAWRTRCTVEQPRIVAARVRAGAWRWFDLELDDGTHVVLLGASPVQFPARLMPDSREKDLTDLDLLMGPDAVMGPQGPSRDGAPGN